MCIRDSSIRRRLSCLGRNTILRFPLQATSARPRRAASTVIYSSSETRIPVEPTKNRVSNYFQAPERLNPKTRQLVSHIADFDIIVTETEFEALVLENSMIKKYKPKYNILLKDDKGYPYIRLNMDAPYPAFSVVSKPGHDGARYFGPYPGRVAARRAIDTIRCV